MIELAQYGPWIRRLIRLYLRLRPWLGRVRKVAGIDAQLRIRILKKRTQFPSRSPAAGQDLRLWAAAAVRRYRSQQQNEPKPAGKLQ